MSIESGLCLHNSITLYTTMQSWLTDVAILFVLVDNFLTVNVEANAYF